MGKINIFNNSTEFTTFKQGDVIFKEGDSGELAYAVKAGELDIMLGEQVVEHVLPGGIFGEMALIDHKTRSASVVAVTDCQLVPINKQRFMFLVQETPYFALDVMSLIVERLRRQNASFEGCIGAKQ
jgi:CRP-like cAMP-binding protein